MLTAQQNRNQKHRDRMQTDPTYAKAYGDHYKELHRKRMESPEYSTKHRAYHKEVGRVYREKDIRPNWNSMKQRCYNEDHVGYKYHGIKGVEVCDEWIDNYERFEEDMFDSYIDGYCLHRIDNDGDYSKENCIWMSHSEHTTHHRSEA